MNSLIKAQSGEVSRSESIEMTCEAIRLAYNASKKFEDLEESRACLAAMDQILARLPAFKAEFERGMRSATATEITDVGQALIACYPAGPQISDKATAIAAAVYSSTLVEDIQSLAPSVIGVMTGCRKLRRRLKFLPSIAEVYQAVDAAESAFRHVSQCCIPDFQHARDVLADKIKTADERLSR